MTDLGKLMRDTPFANEMLDFLRGVTTRRASGPYLHFVQQVVIPHASIFSYLVMTGELFAAVSLLTGTVTRLGAAVAMVLFLNYMMAKGRWFWSPDSEDAAVFFIALVVFLAARVVSGESTVTLQGVGRIPRCGNLIVNAQTKRGIIGRLSRSFMPSLGLWEAEKH